MYERKYCSQDCLDEDYEAHSKDFKTTREALEEVQGFLKMGKEAPTVRVHLQREGRERAIELLWTGAFAQTAAETCGGGDAGGAKDPPDGRVEEQSTDEAHGTHSDKSSSPLRIDTFIPLSLLSLSSFTFILSISHTARERTVTGEESSGHGA